MIRPSEVAPEIVFARVAWVRLRRHEHDPVVLRLPDHAASNAAAWKKSISIFQELVEEAVFTQSTCVPGLEALRVAAAPEVVLPGVHHDGAVDHAELAVQGRHGVPDVDHGFLRSSEGQDVSQVADMPAL